MSSHLYITSKRCYTYYRYKMDIFDFQEIEPQYQKEMRESYGLYDRHRGFVCFGPNKLIIPRIFKELGPVLRNIEVRKDDIWIGGFSRSGTHWLAELTWLLGNNLNFEKSLSIHHEQRILYFDFHEEVIKHDENKSFNFIEATQRIFTSLPSPRYFKTHFPLSYLPPALLDTAKMVYIARDPRDVAVSCFYFYKSHGNVDFKADFKTMWNQFMKGHCDSLWTVLCQCSRVLETKDNKNLLFLFYEELHEDLPGTIKRVAKFLGHEYTEEQYSSLAEHLNFNNMKKNKNINYDKMLGNASQEVVRKGKAGGWREEFDDEMTLEAEAWIADQLKDTDFKYPHMK